MSRGRPAAPPALELAQLELRDLEQGVTLRVRVKPRAGRDQLGGVRAGALQVRLGAAPVEGEANRALVRFLARALDVAPGTIELRQGQSGRDKLLHVAGLEAAELRRRLAGD